ncbi:IPExxxVDY family protein [Xanthovirga aplysinae]|uniref:IPExxxVDY family protein n=1 Tax=Xanthovirga aplysinae TaxID=2529853 RepID=UPI0012BC57CB|nr:IPExxxVDY family protein [Xanthovirga aplysinae]MTI29744.1 IPExxxVDY family protein [Xanthovirga aplysinae]
MTNKLIIDYDYDFGLIGIESKVKGYKLAWLINSVLGVHLIKGDDIKLTLPQQNYLLISNFLYKEEYNLMRLLKNSCERVEKGKVSHENLIPECGDFDYFILLEGCEWEIGVIQKIISKLELLDEVTGLGVIEAGQLPSREYLIF